MANTHDRPGPHPENQRKRSELRGPRHALIGVLVLASVAAIVAGALAATRGMNVLGVSVVSPFASPRGSGIFLAVVVGASQAFAAWRLIGHYAHARLASLVAALLIVAWSALNGMLLGGAAFALVLFAVGALEVMLVAGCTPRHP